MFRLKFKDVRIESFGLNLAPNEVTSAQLEDRLAELYQRLGIPFGTLEKLTGVQTRRLWHDGFLPSQAATPAAKQALERVSFDSNLIGALMSCSITRDYFEPATACMIHNALQLPETAMVTDVGNACLGFMLSLIHI